MPSGKTHLRIELFVLPLCVALLFAAQHYQLIAVSWEEMAIFAGAYLFSSLMLSPDLDSTT
jgi:uncharacterized metal-binding protein